MEGEVTLVAYFSYFLAFIIDICILVYALILSKKMEYSGALYKTTLFAGLSAFVFGLHHLGEVFLHDVPYGAEITESVEGVAALLLLIATYNLYKLTEGFGNE